MMPEPIRRRIGQGEDTTLVAGFGLLKDALEEADADTLVIFDTHWFTTTEHVVNGRAHHKGVYTSEELPNAITDYAYDFAGAPELAREIEDLARERSIPLVNADNQHIPQHYPTLNVLHYVRRGPERVLSVGVCQTATAEDYLEFGEVIGQAARRSRGRVALLASGGMSHKFWPLKELRTHGGYDPANVLTPEAREIDGRILDLWAEGDHAAVIDLYPEYRPFSPEGFFGHYLMLAGALGGRRCTARGRLLSKYENAVGTGQVHVLFDLGAPSAEAG
jgi:3,4-dihydroxyphenylacetate 2,3-dioxygenase